MKARIAERPGLAATPRTAAPVLERPDGDLLSAEDLRQLAERGIPAAEALRQLRFLASPPPPLRLARPCTVGDGIRRLAPDDHAPLLARFDAALAAGRVTKLVPASGAATRMFRQLIELRHELRHEPRETGRDSLERRAIHGDKAAHRLLRFFGELPRGPFAPALGAELAREGRALSALLAAGDFEPIFSALLDRSGLGWAEAPKALIPFHLAPSGPRTAFEEHLVEAASYAADRDGRCRLHFTIAADARARFERHAHEASARLLTEAGGAGLRFEISYSVQSPATDTLALAADGRPFREPSGRLLLRPGGHGSLLGNLDALQADLVFIKNVDNVVPDRLKGSTITWKRLLGGYLLMLQEHVFDLTLRLEAGDPRATAEGVELLVDGLKLPASCVPAAGEREAFVRERLDRPLRVCGVVLNTGEPGGGPFWVHTGREEITRQIVETSQVANDPEQQEVLAAATHFNPVDLVCAVRDAHGRPFDLPRFSDPRTAFVAHKSHLGRPLRALEHPGLWNGAMARWITVFVEVPSETFAPVKTVFDLLRSEHH